MASHPPAMPFVSRVRAAASLLLRGAGSLDAAGHGRRWVNAKASPDSAQRIHADAATLSARAAYFSMNNPHGARIVESLVGNLVGTGIVPRSLHRDETVRRGLAIAWNPWIDSVDAEGRVDFYGFQANLMRDLAIYGEGLSLWGSDTGTMAPTLRRLHPEQLDRSKTQQLDNGGAIIQGVEFAADGSIVAYWIRPRAPGDALPGLPFSSQRFAKRDVLHVFRPIAPGQVRGLSWFAPVLLSASELEQYVDAMLVRLKVAALHTGYVSDTDGSESPYTELPQSLEQTSGPLKVDLQAGAIFMLPPAKQIKFNEPPDPGETAPFATAILRTIAAGVSITFEQLTGDYSNTNYSSARAALLEFRRFAEGVQHHTLVFQFCRPVWQRFIQWQVLTGTIPATAYQFDRAAFNAVKWLPPAWPWVDPETDAKAAVIELDNLLRSRSEIVAERGYDIEALDDEIAADQARADRLRLARVKPAASPVAASPETRRQ